jgi:hypothetical protein
MSAKSPNGTWLTVLNVVVPPFLVLLGVLGTLFFQHFENLPSLRGTVIALMIGQRPPSPPYGDYRSTFTAFMVLGNDRNVPVSVFDFRCAVELRDGTAVKLDNPHWLRGRLTLGRDAAVHRH